MSITVPVKANVVPVDPAVFNSGMPVTSHPLKELVNGVNNMYEGLYGTKIPANTSITQSAHNHDGNGLGAFIPKHIASVSYGLPEFGSGATANHKTIDSASLVYPYETIDGTSVVEGIAEYRWIDNPKADKYFLLAQERIYLNKGVTSVVPSLLMGAKYTSGNYKIRYALLNSANTSVLDYAEETISGGINCAYRSIPNAHNSGGAYLWVNSGNVLTSPGYYQIAIYALWDGTTPGSTTDGPYVFSLDLTEA